MLTRGRRHTHASKTKKRNYCESRTRTESTATKQDKSGHFEFSAFTTGKIHFVSALIAAIILIICLYLLIFGHFVFRFISNRFGCCSRLRFFLHFILPLHIQFCVCVLFFSFIYFVVIRFMCTEKNVKAGNEEEQGRKQNCDECEFF